MNLTDFSWIEIQIDKSKFDDIEEDKIYSIQIDLFKENTVVRWLDSIGYTYLGFDAIYLPAEYLMFDQLFNGRSFPSQNGFLYFGIEQNGDDRGKTANAMRSIRQHSIMDEISKFREIKTSDDNQWALFPTIGDSFRSTLDHLLSTYVDGYSPSNLFCGKLRDFVLQRGKVAVVRHPLNESLEDFSIEYRPRWDLPLTFETEDKSDD